jgi:hypothetical protein
MEETGDVIRGGIPTIKTLTTYGWMSDDGHRCGVMTELAKHGGLSIIHAEDDALAKDAHTFRTVLCSPSLSRGA